MVNILSLVSVESHFKFSFDIGVNEVFMLHFTYGRKMCFEPTDRGRYITLFLTPRDEDNAVALKISTVEGNNAQCTKREVTQAERARLLQIILLFPRDRDLERTTGLLLDSSITPRDLINVQAIFGPSIGNWIGKSTKSKYHPMTIEAVKIP